MTPRRWQKEESVTVEQASSGRPPNIQTLTVHGLLFSVVKYCCLCRRRVPEQRHAADVYFERDEPNSLLIYAAIGARKRDNGRLTSALD